MALLQSDGSVIFRKNGVTYVRSYGANANMTGVNAAKKKKIVVDTTAIDKKAQRKLNNILARKDMRKQLAEMRRTG